VDLEGLDQLLESARGMSDRVDGGQKSVLKCALVGNSERVQIRHQVINLLLRQDRPESRHL
jgi:hypothetical protein